MCEGIGDVLSFTCRIGSFHGVEKIFLIIFDVKNLEQSGSVFSNRAVIDNAVQFAFPGVADLFFRNDFDRHFFTGNIFTIVNISIRPAAAVRNELQAVKTLLIHFFPL